MNVSKRGMRMSGRRSGCIPVLMLFLGSVLVMTRSIRR